MGQLNKILATKGRNLAIIYRIIARNEFTHRRSYL